MKYRGWRWWLTALAFQVRLDLLRSRPAKLVRNILRVTPKDQLEDVRQLLLEHGEILYGMLTIKYPEYKWVEKYVRSQNTGKVAELLSLLFVIVQEADALWSYEVDRNICIEFINSMREPFRTLIRLKDGSKHSIVVLGYNQERQTFIVHDPLGDYHTDYKLYYGGYVEFSYDLLEEISIGHPMSMYCHFSNDKRQQAISIFRGVKIFTITYEEYFLFYHILPSMLQDVIDTPSEIS